jgi:ethanolamine ammonia-lyase small subunit
MRPHTTHALSTNPFTPYATIAITPTYLAISSAIVHLSERGGLAIVLHSAHEGRCRYLQRGDAGRGLSED